MSKDNQNNNPVAEIFKSLFYLIIVACIAVYFGFISLPQPIMNLLERLAGNDPEAFDKLTLQMPENQVSFIAAIKKNADAYTASENDLAKATIRAQRKADICAITKEYTNGEWLGVVDKVTTNGGGDGVLAIKISRKITLKTWNNSFSDVAQNTLIKQGTPIYNVAATLKAGDKVKFSGVFFVDEADCLNESSMTIDGAMLDPEFIIRFTRLEAI